MSSLKSLNYEKYIEGGRSIYMVQQTEKPHHVQLGQMFNVNGMGGQVPTSSTN